MWAEGGLGLSGFRSTGALTYQVRGGAVWGGVEADVVAEELSELEAELETEVEAVELSELEAELERLVEAELESDDDSEVEAELETLVEAELVGSPCGGGT